MQSVSKTLALLHCATSPSMILPPGQLNQLQSQLDAAVAKSSDLALRQKEIFREFRRQQETMKEQVQLHLDAPKAVLSPVAQWRSKTQLESLSHTLFSPLATSIRLLYRTARISRTLISSWASFVSIAGENSAL